MHLFGIWSSTLNQNLAVIDIIVLNKWTSLTYSIIQLPSIYIFLFHEDFDFLIRLVSIYLICWQVGEVMVVMPKLILG